MPNPPRGCSYLYGHGAVEPFLKNNDLVGVIRAHQCKEEGVGFAYTDNRIIDYKFPYITTVFSASNYCGTHGNKAAVMVFYNDDIQVCTACTRDVKGLKSLSLPGRGHRARGAEASSHSLASDDER